MVKDDVNSTIQNNIENDNGENKQTPNGEQNKSGLNFADLFKNIPNGSDKQEQNENSNEQNVQEENSRIQPPLNEDNNDAKLDTNKNNTPSNEEKGKGGGFDLSSLFGSLGKKQDNQQEEQAEHQQNEDVNNATEIGDGEENNEKGDNELSNIFSKLGKPHTKENNMNNQVEEKKPSFLNPQTPQGNLNVQPTQNSLNSQTLQNGNTENNINSISSFAENNQQSQLNQKQNQQKQNNISFASGSNIYDIQKELLKLTNSFDDAAVVKDCIDIATKSTDKDEDLDKVLKKIDSDIKETKNIKQWNEAYSTKFTILTGELTKRLNTTNGKITIKDLIDWRDDYLKPLQKEVKEQIAKMTPGVLQNFLKKMDIGLNYIDNTYDSPFDKRKINNDLSTLHRSISEKLAYINDNFFVKLWTIIYDFFSGRKTFTDLERTKTTISNIRDKIEAYISAKTPAEKETIMSAINDEMIDLRSVLKSQKMDLKEFKETQEEIDKSKIVDIDGIKIITDMIIEFGQDTIKGQIKDLSSELQWLIKKNVYNRYSPKFSEKKALAEIVIDMLKCEKQDDVEKKNNLRGFKHIIKRVFRGNLEDENFLINKEFNEKLELLEAQQNGVYELMDLDEVDKKTANIIEAVNKLSNVYEKKINEISVVISQAQLIGTPIPQNDIARIHGIIHNFISNVETIKRRCADYYGYNPNELEWFAKIQEKKDSFEKGNKLYSKLIGDLQKKELNKKTNRMEEKNKPGKNSDRNLLFRIIDRDEITQYKHDKWKNIEQLINQLKQNMINNIENITHINTSRQTNTIMEYERDRHKIINDNIEKLMNAGMINTRKEPDRGAFGGRF